VHEEALRLGPPQEEARAHQTQTLGEQHEEVELLAVEGDDHHGGAAGQMRRSHPLHEPLEQPQLHWIAHRAALARLGLVAAGEDEGAERWSAPCELPGKGFWFAPTVFTGVTSSHRIAREEIFGPVLSVLTFRTAEEVERMWGVLAAGKIAYVSTDHAPWGRSKKVYDGDIFACGAGLTGMQSFAPLMATLLLERGLPLSLMASLCAERPAKFHGLYPKKGAIRLGFDADLCVLERGDFVFDEADIQDREDAKWSPYHGRAMRARVAATYLRGAKIWDGKSVLARPGTGQFVPRQHREQFWA
jgi:hypothetical protein